MKKYPGLKKKLPHRACERKLLVDKDSSISFTRQAELLGISRASLYTTPTPQSEEQLQLLHTVDEIYTDQPTYGSRRIRFILARDYEIDVGRDRVRSAMQTLGLQAIYPKPDTSKPHPDHKVYPYLLRGMCATHPNHIWGTDITYIRLRDGFCYLCAMLDWHSRKVLAWSVSTTMHADFCVEVLESALTQGIPDFHNSDQGVQFTSDPYISPLKKHDSIRISMDGRGRCMDNIFTERLWRTVKYEDVYLKDYQTPKDVREGLSTYFDHYNNRRPHQSLDYKTPNEVYSHTN